MDQNLAISVIRTLPALALVGFFLAELKAGIYRRGTGLAKEHWLNGLSFLQDRIVVEPLAVFLGATQWAHVAPGYQGSLEGTSFWLALPVFAVANDFVHYWFHRWAHSSAWLWRIHATHHTATQMSVAVTPRLNIVWRLIFPSTYIGAAAVYVGLPEVYIVWWAITGTLNMCVHTSMRWDLPLYERPHLRPIGRMLELILVTPDAHHTHHGNGKLATGRQNYGQTLIIWDRLFGTLHLPHARQDAFGANGEVNGSMARQLLWPFPQRHMRRRTEQGSLAAS